MSGMTVYEQKRYFSEAFPNGTDVYVGLFTTLPNAAGEGGVECSEAWYARKAHQDWLSRVVGTATVRRENVGAIEIDDVDIGSPDVTIVGWGIFDALTDGNLRWSGPLRNAAGVEAEKTLVATNQLRWTEGELIAQIDPTTDQTKSMLMTTLSPATNTTDATPATQDLLTLADEEAVHLVATIIARQTTGGGTDYHYYRRLRASFYRDATTSLWALRHFTVDGAETQYNLAATVTGELVISGNTIQAQYTGEAAVNLTWYTKWEQLSDADPD